MDMEMNESHCWKVYKTLKQTKMTLCFAQRRHLFRHVKSSLHQHTLDNITRNKDWLKWILTSSSEIVIKWLLSHTNYTNICDLCWRSMIHWLNEPGRRKGDCSPLGVWSSKDRPMQPTLDSWTLHGWCNAACNVGHMMEHMETNTWITWWNEESLPTRRYNEWSASPMNELLYNRTWTWWNMLLRSAERHLSCCLCLVWPPVWANIHFICNIPSQWHQHRFWLYSILHIHIFQRQW